VELVVSVYACAAVLYCIGFGEPALSSAALAGFALCATWHLVDLVARFRFAAWQNGALVRDRSGIRRHYVRSGLLPLNVVSLLPAVLSLCLLSRSAWLWLPLLLRIPRSWVLIDHLCLALDASNFSLRKLLKLLFVFAMMAHATACLYGAVSSAEARQWDEELQPPGEPPAEVGYSLALWWAITALSTFGTAPKPVTLLAYALGCVSFSLSIFVSIYMIGNIGMLIDKLDAVATAFRKKVAAVDTFVAAHGLPREIAARAHRYQSCAWERGAGHNLHEVMEQLNPTLQADIKRHTCFSIFIAVPLFQNINTKFTSALMRVIEIEAFPMGEWVCRMGSMSTAMYVILRGSVSIVIDEAKMVCVKTLRSGEFFGERCLFGKEKRNASVLAASVVELVVLHHAVFKRVLDKFPGIEAALLQAKEEREQQMALDKERLAQQQVAKPRANSYRRPMCPARQSSLASLAQSFDQRRMRHNSNA